MNIACRKLQQEKLLRNSEGYKCLLNELCDTPTVEGIFDVDFYRMMT